MTEAGPISPIQAGWLAASCRLYPSHHQTANKAPRPCMCVPAHPPTPALRSRGYPSAPTVRATPRARLHRGEKRGQLTQTPATAAALGL